MAHNNAVGKKGENMAEKFLINKGYNILERNYRFRRAEIDIIARLNQKMVFVEVKTRSNGNFGFPEMAVGDAKMEAIYQCAEAYIDQNAWLGPIRFDIIAIILQHPVDIMHFKDAF